MHFKRNVASEFKDFFQKYCHQLSVVIIIFLPKNLWITFLKALKIFFLFSSETWPNTGYFLSCQICGPTELASLSFAPLNLESFSLKCLVPSVLVAREPRLQHIFLLESNSLAIQFASMHRNFLSLLSHIHKNH